MYGTNRERPSTVQEAWQAFMDSGLRIGSPATALAPPVCNGTIKMNEVDGFDNWWFDFMDLMAANSDKGWDYDFVAIHSYNQECDAEGFLSLVDQTYELTGKPIWITEFGVARWDSEDWNGNNAQTQKKVIDFMVEVLNGLEERPYVERYAWFPFDPNDAYGGASGIFDYESGELNALGQIYAQLGLPEGYDATTYPTEVPTLVNIKTDKKVLILGESTTVSLSDNKEVQWSSDNEDVITIDADGNVVAVGIGEANVTATTADGTDSVKFTVIVPTFEKVTIKAEDDTNISQMPVGAEATLTIETDPVIDTDLLDVTWTSSNSDVVAIDGNKIIALSKGTAQITVTVEGKTANLVINVYEENEALIKAKNDLSSKINAAETLDKDAYTEESWKIFASALAAAKNVFANENATIEEVKQATDVLENVQTSLVKVDNSDKDGQTDQNAQITISIAKSTILQTEQTQCTVIGEQKPIYESSNPAVATVDANGVVTGVSAGTAIITATSTVLGCKASVTVNVIKPTVKWNVTYKTVPLQLKKGKKANTTTVLQPTGLQDGDSIREYKSSKTKIATVKMNSKGKLTITPKKVGKTTITVITKHGAKATFTLKVQKQAVKVTKLTVDNAKKKLTLKKGKSFTLKTTKKYITALDKVTFTSNKKSVATVSSKGKITAKKKGKANITVRCQKKKVVIKVTVK